MIKKSQKNHYQNTFSTKLSIFASTLFNALLSIILILPITIPHLKTIIHPTHPFIRGPIIHQFNRFDLWISLPTTFLNDADFLKPWDDDWVELLVAALDVEGIVGEGVCLVGEGVGGLFVLKNDRVVVCAEVVVSKLFVRVLISWR